MTIDPDVADDLMSSFDEHYDKLQHTLNKLSQAPDNELVNSIFRDVHTIKGNAGMVQIQPLIDFAHSIEETIEAIRQQQFPPSAKICDLLLTGIDRLKDLHTCYVFDRPNDFVDEGTIIQGFEAMSASYSPEEAAAAADKLYLLFYPEESGSLPEIMSHFTFDDVANHASYLKANEEQYSDLDFFRSLSLQTDLQTNFWRQRTDQLVYLAVKLCSISTDIHVDLLQLVAAIYIHDAGMAFLPHDIVNKQSRFNPMQQKQLQKHVDWSYGMLNRIPGWEEAATIVLQHHEQEDGSGYPNNLTTEQLHEGAKILAILDAFYAMTNFRSDRSHRRSILRAISEVNACSGTQFNTYWVSLFNHVVKSESKLGTL